ncbi:MAG: hypothetical protein WC900_00945 [Oscillospiraceae bacterium]|jgi:para-nitrobenzyl esterase
MDLKNNSITMGELLKNPAAKALLERELPQYMKHPMLSLAKNMPLSGIIGFSKGYVSPEKINMLLIRLKEL